MVIFKLNELCGKKRLKVKNLSQATGISYVTLCKIYNNKPINVTIRILDRLITYLNCALHELIEIK